MSRFGALVAVLLSGGLGLTGCSHDRKPYLHSGALTQGAGNDAGGGLLNLPPPTPPMPDAGGLCGNDVVPVVTVHPNLYFILDTSGSMGEPMPSGSQDLTMVLGHALTRYDAARISIETVLQTVGHRVHYGVATFPGDPQAGCSAPYELFPMQAGDAVSFARANDTEGKVLSGLVQLLVRQGTGGSTPTALAIESSTAMLAKFAETSPTFAILLTDGAPNCSETTCTADQCTVNIEGFCPVNGNCCDPSLGIADFSACLDADRTLAAVSALAAASVKTYVIGMSVADAYTDLLNRLAIAGGTAQPGDTAYYPTKTATDLANELSKIGLEVGLSCDIPLASTPPDAHLVNVFFDAALAPFDDVDGWTWADSTTVRLVGKACDDLKSGAFSQVQVVAGCPTVTR